MTTRFIAGDAARLNTGTFSDYFEFAMSEQPPLDFPLIEGVDYTLEKGCLVFTKSFLLRRGSCCGSGCRHCPFPVAEPSDRESIDRAPVDRPPSDRALSEKEEPSP